MTGLRRLRTEEYGVKVGLGYTERTVSKSNKQTLIKYITLTCLSLKLQGKEIEKKSVLQRLRNTVKNTRSSRLELWFWSTQLQR